MNIGAGESRKRVIMGVTMLAVGLGIAAALALAGVSRWWLIGLFLALWVGALGFFQARAKT